MFEERVVFGERTVLLSEVAGRLPRRVLLPGPGVTVAERADRAVDTVAAARAREAATSFGLQPTDQAVVDFSTEERLCPLSGDVLAYAEALVDLGLWRYRVEHAEPGPGLAGLLAARPDALAPAPSRGEVLEGEVGTLDEAMPVDGRWPDAVLTSVGARERLISHLRAEQYRDLATLSGCYPGIHQFLATEIALALHIGEAEAAAMLGTAAALRDRLPDTLSKLSDGVIDDAKAIAMVAATTTTTAEVAAVVERRVLPDAGTVTATTVRRRAGRAVIAADPDGAADRHRRARAERFMSRRAEPDGMARLSVYAPATDVATVWEAVTGCADALKRPGDTRTLANRRVDALVDICRDILAGGGWTGLRLPDKGRGRPRVSVTVPYTVLVGQREPCDLDGHGPITTEQALTLVGQGDLYRMVCDPLSGAILDYGRTRYRPPPHLAEFVKVRDGECPMPCCHHPAARGQVDHIVPARPDPATGLPTLGTTSADNLAAPCHHHHLGKDAGRGFALRRDAATGAYTWTTPLGRSYTWTPEPHWHDDTDGEPGDHPGPAGGTAPKSPRNGPPEHCPAGGDTGAGPPPAVIDDDWADGFSREMDPFSRETHPQEPIVGIDMTDGDKDPPPF